MAENTGNVGLAELADVMEASSSTYGLIARMYLEEPSAEFIDALRQTRFPAATGIPPHRNLPEQGRRCGAG